MSILAYHMVSPTFNWGLGRVTPKQFDNQIQAGKNAGYRFLSLSDYVARYPEVQKCATLTFDDGYDSIYEYALPVLKKHRLTAAVFVMPAFVGKSNTWDVNWGGLLFRHLSWNQIKDLAKNGWEIGSHGYSHRDLTCLTDHALKKEVRDSRRLLEERLDRPVNAISYPFGNCNERVYRQCLDAGYENGFIMSRQPKNVPQLFALQRLGVYLTDLKPIFKAKLSHKCNTVFRGVQSILDVCSDGTVLVKQRLNPKNNS